MIDGITFELSSILPPEWFALKRGDRVVDHGRWDEFQDKYKNGDVVLISEATWEWLKARVALAGEEGS